MPKLLYLKYHYTILGEISSGSDSHRFQFDVPNENATPVTVEILTDDKEVIATQKIEVSDDLWEFLQTESREIPSELHSVLAASSSDISSATRYVLSLIKYCFGWIGLDELLMSHKNAEWSTDNLNWKQWPRLFKVVAHGYITHPLNTNTATAIQNFIDGGFKPFIALRHLHKARIENIPHYKWIDATIAA